MPGLFFIVFVAQPSEVQPCAGNARDRLHARADDHVYQKTCFPCALAERRLPLLPGIDRPKSLAS